MKPRVVTTAVIVVLIASCGAGEAQTVAPGPSVVDLADLALKILGGVGAAVAFTIGLRQDQRAEQWKRAGPSPCHAV